MAITDGQAACGAKLGYGTIASGSYTDFASVISISPPSIEVADVEKTNHDSDDCTREYTAGVKEPGEISGTMVWDDTLCATYYGLIGTDQDYRIEIPNAAGSEWVCTGYMKTFGTEPLEVDGLVVNTFTIKVSGLPTYTAAPA